MLSFVKLLIMNNHIKTIGVILLFVIYTLILWFYQPIGIVIGIIICIICLIIILYIAIHSLFDDDNWNWL